MSYEERKSYPFVRDFMWRIRRLHELIPATGRLTKNDKSKIEEFFSTLTSSSLLFQLPPNIKNRIIMQIRAIENSQTRKTARENLLLLYRTFRLYRLDSSTRQTYPSSTPSNNSRTIDELSSRIKELEQQISSPKINPEPSESDVQEITLDALKGKQILFGIMPFGIEFDDVWAGAIKRAASSIGFYPLRVDMLTESSNITDDIMEAIKMSKIIVVDVSNNNPNVMFEFGYALALKKAPVVISRSTDSLPFDIQNIRTIFYQNNWKGIEKLREELQKFIKGADKSSKKSN